MDILSVKNLCKRYEKFALTNVSFTLSSGTITGFIGRNGAGKTTTLKSLLNFVHPDSGEISFFGKPFQGNEFEIKQRLGFVSGGIDYYPKKKIRTITAVTKRFYSSWDDGAYHRYLNTKCCSLKVWTKQAACLTGWSAANAAARGTAP